MKKILSLALATLMLVSIVPTVFAAENETDYTNGTAITLNGTGTEEYTVTVPAKMVPGDTGTVKAEGTWAADKFLNVGVPSTVTLTYGAQSMDVAVTGGSFSLIGNSVDPVSKEVDVSIEEASRLFGTWEGVLEYSVDLIQKGDVNRDGVIDAADVQILKDYVQNTTELTDDIADYGDITGDGEVKAGDYKKLKDIVIAHGIEVADE